MRLILDLLVVLMLAAIAGGVYLHLQGEKEMERRIEQARREVLRFESQLALQAALPGTEVTTRGYPRTVNPDWFTGNLPRNPLLSPAHPWLEIAGESDRYLLHPIDRTAMTRDEAQFWYNPYTGALRARVPAGIADASALQLYNRVNGTNLTSLFETEGVQGLRN